jgi:hypothetical protein
VDTSTLTEITPLDVLFWAALIGVAAWIAYLVYRSMDHPRLVLTPTPDGPRARRRDVFLYVVTIPLLTLAWWVFFFAVLLINANEINAAQVVIFPIALVIAIRTLAFVAPHAAHELAKVIPIALVAFVILDGNIRPVDDLGEMVDSLDALDVTDGALLLLFLFDYVLTAIWYWGWIRWGQPLWAARKAQRSGKHVADDNGRVAVLPDADGADRSP